MAAAIDFANVISSSINGGGSTTTITVNCTCAVTDNFLLVCAAIDSSSGATPLSVTYGGTAMTAVAHHTNTQGDVAWYYLNTPTTGLSLPVLATYAAGNNALSLVAVPMSGVNTGVAPTAGTGTQGVPSANIACSTPAATANDIGFAATSNRGVSQTPGGAPQTNLTTPANSINGVISFASSYILGPNAGNFTWTITSGNWSAIGITVFGTSAGGGGALTGPLTMGLTDTIDQLLTGLPV